MATRLRGPGATLEVAGLTGGFWMLVLIARLFAGGTIGMADQGDSRRLLCQLGVRADRPFSARPSSYVTTTWVEHSWYGEACGADGSGEPYRSSQLVLLRMAKHLTAAFDLPGALDLRAVGILCSLVVGFAVAALVLVLPGRTWLRVMFASLVGLLAADAAVAEYFVSAYSEAAGLLGILLLCPALLWLWRDGRSTWPRLICVAMAATFAMTAKSQTTTLLPAILLALVLVPHRGLGGGRPRQRSLREVTSRWPGLLTCVLLTVTATSFLSHNPRRFEELTAYNQVFIEILPKSRDKAGDLRSLGVDPALAQGSGRSILDPASVARLPGYLEFRREVDQAGIVRFYATHPGRLPGLAAEGLRGMTVWRQDYLGTYTADSGQPAGSRECRICAYATLFGSARILPLSIVLLWALVLVGGIKVVRRRHLGHAQRAIGRLAIVLVTAAVSQFAAVMLSQGLSRPENLIFTNFLTGLCVPTALACVWLLTSQVPDDQPPRRRPEPSGGR